MPVPVRHIFRKSENMEILMTLVGGLGFFLYGMKMMSEGLQKAAGPKMRSILEMFTRNRVVGVLVGTFFSDDRQFCEFGSDAAGTDGRDSHGSQYRRYGYRPADCF